MPHSIFSRKSTITSRSSRICQEADTLLTQALKDVVRRLSICYRSVCCFPLDQIVPSNHRKVKNGLNIYLKPTPVLGSQKVLPEIKIIHILPRSRVSFNEPVRVQSEMTTVQVKSEVTTATKAKSDVISTNKVTINDVSNSKKVTNKGSFEKQIKSVSIEQPKTAKKSKTRMLKEKSRKIFDYGSGSIKSTFKHRKKSSGSLITMGKKKSKNGVPSENKWIKTKRMIKISNPSTMKWMRHSKPRRSMTTTSIVNEESAGDGPVTPKLSVNKKIPLRWNLIQEQGFSDTDEEFIKKDADKQVALEII